MRFVKKWNLHCKSVAENLARIFDAENEWLENLNVEVFSNDTSVKSRVVAMQEGDDDDPEDLPVDTEPNQEFLENSDSDESISTDENLSETDRVAEEETDLAPLDSEESGSDDES